MRILFVCWGNRDRSPTAEDMFRTIPGLEVRSAGVWRFARNPLTTELVDWADRIFVMEDSQRTSILRARPLANGKISVLNIPNIYRRNDPELIELLRERVWLSGFS